MPKINIFNRFGRLLSREVIKQSGFGLVESLIAVAVLGTALFMMLGGLSTGTIGIDIQQEDIIASNLARTQLEYTKSLAYHEVPYSYTLITDVPNGYSINTDALPVTGKDANIQKIRVTVYRDGSVVYTLEGYKVNR